MKGIKCLCKGIVFHRHSYEVHMIAHEKVAPYLQSIFFTIHLQLFQILKVIIIVFKDSLTVVTPLSNMMRESDCNCPIVGMC